MARSTSWYRARRRAASAMTSGFWSIPPASSRRTSRWHTSCIEMRSTRVSGPGCPGRAEQLAWRGRARGAHDERQVADGSAGFLAQRGERRARRRRGGEHRATESAVLGAGGRVARTKLYTARSDGYVMMTESAPGGAIDEIIGRAGYKASEFIAIFGWSVVSWQLCVRKDSPIQTFQQFVDECHKRRVVVGTIGRSGSSHIQLAALQKELNLPFGMVHFEGSGKAYPAVMGGHVDAAISGPGSGSRMRESLHFLAVTGEAREKALPDVPTLTELGFRVTPIDQIWYAMTTPKVPDDRIATLSSAFAKAFEDKMLWE